MEHPSAFCYEDSLIIGPLKMQLAAAIDRAEAAEAHLAECVAHEEQTHKTISKLVGCDTSLLDGIHRLKDRGTMLYRALQLVANWGEAQAKTWHGNPLCPEMCIEIDAAMKGWMP